MLSLSSLSAIFKLKALLSMFGIFCFSVTVNGGQSLRRDLLIVKCVGDSSCVSLMSFKSYRLWGTVKVLYLVG